MPDGTRDVYYNNEHRRSRLNGIPAPSCFQPPVPFTGGNPLFIVIYSKFLLRSYEFIIAKLCSFIHLSQLCLSTGRASARAWDGTSSRAPFVQMIKIPWHIYKQGMRDRSRQTFLESNWRLLCERSIIMLSLCHHTLAHYTISKHTVIYLLNADTHSICLRNSGD